MIDKPQNITTLIGRCEINETGFKNDDMSVALKFGELLWNRLERFSEHYEKMSGLFVDGDIRGPMMAHAAKDMRHILNDCKKDMERC